MMIVVPSICTDYLIVCFIENKNNNMISKEDFMCLDGLYYIGDVIDVDGSPWVNEEQLELIILEINNGTI